MRSLFPPLFAGKNNTLEFSLEPFHSLFVSNSVLPTHGAGSPLAVTYSVACKKKSLVKTEGFKNTFGLESRRDFSFLYYTPLSLNYRSRHSISAYVKTNFKFLYKFRVICLCSFLGPRKSKFTPLPWRRGGEGIN